MLAVAVDVGTVFDAGIIIDVGADASAVVGLVVVRLFASAVDASVGLVAAVDVGTAFDAGIIIDVGADASAVVVVLVGVDDVCSVVCCCC